MSTIDATMITKYFPSLSTRQQEQFAALDALYRDWNEKINVISRKDIDNLYLHHVLHSLAISRMLQFRSGTTVLDFGTGGGFPGIPIAILFPEVKFHLIDGTGKKIRVAQAVIDEIGLENCHATHRRGEDEHNRYDFIVSRAVMPLPDLVKIVRKNIAPVSKNALPNGILCLKGGDLEAELSPFRRIVQVQSLSEWFDEEWFQEKYCIYLPL